jgi:glutathione S-transferase
VVRQAAHVYARAPSRAPMETRVKLYQVNLSPFAARIRVQIYAKGLDIPFADPPGGLGSDSYRRVNPTGKVPALALDDGSVLPESTAIAEYLEDWSPEPSLRPGDARDRARMRLLVALGDHYLFPALHALYPQVLEPEKRDPKVVAEGLAALATRYDWIEGQLSAGPFAVGSSLSLADAALFPIFFFATRVHAALGDADPTSSRPALAAWWKGVAQHPAVRRVDAELAAALAVMLGEQR